MSLAEKIQEDVKSALKGGDKKKLSIARYLSSELKNYLIKENLDRELSKLTDENFYKIVKTQLKQKKESLANFKRKMRCVNCNKSGGTIFSKEDNHLIMKCGN